MNEDVSLTLLLWDLASHEISPHMRDNYLRGVAGAILVCDLTRPETLSTIYRYAETVLTINANVQTAVVANKVDLVKQTQLSSYQIEDVATKLNTVLYLTSAKIDESVESVFQGLSQRLIT